MANQGKRDKAGKMAVLSGWGTSLMLRLSSASRHRLKRAPDKARRQAERKEIEQDTE